MPAPSSFIVIASMEVDAEFEDLFNEVYDSEHIPHLLAVPGVRNITRWKGRPFDLAIGGTIKQMPAPTPIYTAIYELDNPDVMGSPEWAEAVEKGRWASEVRPHTKNRCHNLYEKQLPTEDKGRK
jgi:hypothetical protein